MIQYYSIQSNMISLRFFNFRTNLVILNTQNDHLCGKLERYMATFGTSNPLLAVDPYLIDILNPQTS